MHLEGGVWGVLPTPFADDLSVDHASLERLVGFYGTIGATGVVALGVLGEAVRLDSAERSQVLQTVVQAAGDLPVIAGVSSTATPPAIEEARNAARAGAVAAMLLVPSGDPTVNAAHLAAVSRECGLGIVLQDHPATTGVNVTTASLIETIEQSGVVVAVKAEAPPAATSVAGLTAALDLPVFGGLGGVSLLDELIAGAAGVMTGFAYPEALVETVGRFRDAGYEAAWEAYAPWLPLVLCEAQQPFSLAVRKEILRRRGLIDCAHVRRPGTPLPAEVARALDAHLAVHEFTPTAAPR